MTAASLRALVVVMAAVGVMRPWSARAQAPTAEAAVSAGMSTEQSTGAVAAQVRVFGEVGPRIRYYSEGSWARTSSDSDAFGAAYPYGDRVRLVETYGEWSTRPHGAIVSVRGGRYRTPFGISAASDHAYTGFLRAPLIRYDGYFALSNNFLEHGADVLVGTPHLSVEASVGRPADIGTAQRRPGTDTVLRVQGYAGPFIVGVSHIRTQPYQPAQFAAGRAGFTGVDARFMRSGVELRGELVAGRPFAGVTTTGWYADAIVHRLSMGPVTAVARVEQLDYDTPDGVFALHSRRQTVGARVRLRESVALQMDLLHQSGQLNREYGPMAFDVGVTYTIRR